MTLVSVNARNNDPRQYLRWEHLRWEHRDAIRLYDSAESRGWLALPVNRVDRDGHTSLELSLNIEDGNGLITIHEHVASIEVSIDACRPPGDTAMKPRNLYEWSRDWSPIAWPSPTLEMFYKPWLIFVALGQLIALTWRGRFTK